MTEGVIGLVLGSILFITTGYMLEEVYENLKGNHKRLRKYPLIYIPYYLVIASLLIFSWELFKMGASSLKWHLALPFLGKMF